LKERVVLQLVDALPNPVWPEEMDIGIEPAHLLPVMRQTLHADIDGILLQPQLAFRPQLDMPVLRTPGDRAIGQHAVESAIGEFEFTAVEGDFNKDDCCARVMEML